MHKEHHRNTNITRHDVSSEQPRPNKMSQEQRLSSNRLLFVCHHLT